LPEVGKNETPRIRISVESLSDLIFGLALSIGAIFLVGNSSTDPHVVLSNLITFGFSFLILVLIWIRYKRTISVLRIETASVLRLNIAMLFFVAIEPYLFNLLIAGASLNIFGLGKTPPEVSGFTAELFAIDIGSIYLILGVLTYLVLNQILHRTNVPHPTVIRSIKQYVYTQLTTASMFLISAYPVFWTNHIPSTVLPYGLALWALSFVVSFISRIARPLSRSQKTKQRN
jgi:hypothetical protein